MLDLKFVRGNPQKVQDVLTSRGIKYSLKDFIRLDEQRREKLFNVEQMKNRRNVVSEEIGRLKKAGKDVPDMVMEMRDLSRSIKEKDEEIKNVEGRLQEILLDIPNIPHESVPVGKDAADNTVVRKWGKQRNFGFTPRPHWEIGENLDILDFERGGKVTGTRFCFYKGLGARLERALISFMLDLHTGEHGYTEIFPPFMVNRQSMIGTGQLPKFAEDMFKIEGDRKSVV